MATGPRRGSGRAAGTGGCLREPRRAQPPLGRTPPAAPAVARRAGRARDRGGPGLRRTAPSSSPRTPSSRRRAVTVCDQSYVQPPVWSDVDLGTGRRTERHRQPAPGHDPDRYLSERRTFAAPDGTGVPVTLVRHRDTPLDGTAPALRLRLRRLRVHLRAGLGPRPAQPPRPGRRVRPRPRPRWRGGRTALVARRPAGPEAEHVHRPPRRRRRTGRPGRRHPDRVARAQRRRPAPGCGPRPAAGTLGGGGRGGAVRRRGHHDVRRVRPAHGHRVGRVGRPAPPGGVRLAARLLAVRQPAAGGRRGRTCW